MRVRFNRTAAILAAFLLISLSACKILNNKLLRIHRSTKNDVIRSRMKLPNFIGPTEKVERFFQYYKNRDWKSMESSLNVESDFLSLQKQVRADFDAFVDMEIDLKVEHPEFNDAQDKAQVRVKFEIEKIQARTGSLIIQSGSGLFILSEKGNWDILGYLGDPFWGEGRKRKK